MGKKRNRTQRKKKKRPYRPRKRAVPEVMERAEESYNKGTEALEMHAYQAAERYFKESLAAYPSPDGYYALGSAYMYQEQYEEAIAPFEQAIKFERKNALYWYSLGGASLRAGYLYRALPAFEKAQKYDLQDDEEFTESIYTHLDLIDEAVEMQLEDHPGLDRETYLQQEALYFRAVALQEENQFEQALALFMDYLKVEPEFYRALGNAGVCLISLNRLDEAEAFLQRAIQVNPDYQVARFNLKSLKKQRKKGISSTNTTTVMVDTTTSGDIDEQIVQALYKEGKFLIDEDEDEAFDVEVSNESKTHRSPYRAQSAKKSPKESSQSTLRRILSLFGF